MDIKQIGMVGTGSMGSMLSLLLAEHGIHTHFYDPSRPNAQQLEAYARDTGHSDMITYHKDLRSLCRALSTSTPKAFMFSIPHGGPADYSLNALDPYLDPGDLIMDASNEHWQATERRQKSLALGRVHYVGMGVSGGYQSARHGPSISAGGSEAALDAAFPFLQKIAAKDHNGRPCVAKLGPGGCGHYVKMVHNGIEHGMMTALCETWALLNVGLEMGYEEIAAVFESWNRDGPLRDNFLVDIGAQICRAREGDEFVLSNIRDKVVQDADNSEGTGTWAVEEGVALHVPSPTIAASHIFRVASAYATRRESVAKAGSGVRPGRIQGVDKPRFIQNVHQAVYAAFLLSFIQGLHLLSRASQQYGWHLDFADVLQIWRQGCIIQSDSIVDLLDRVYRSEHDGDNLLASPAIASELQRAYPSMKAVVLRAIEADLHVPALSASHEYHKYSGATDLPTSFQEAELDYFGAHMFDLKTEEPGEPVKGKHHFEWKPARGIEAQ